MPKEPEERRVNAIGVMGRVLEVQKRIDAQHAGIEKIVGDLDKLSETVETLQQEAMDNRSLIRHIYRVSAQKAATAKRGSGR